MDRVFFNGIEIKYKTVKKPIKNIYLEIKDDFVEIRCNKFVSTAHIEKFILKNAEHIIKKFQNSSYYFLFGKKYLKNGIDEKEIYRQKAPEIILPLVYKYSNLMNLHPSKISFRFNKSRWGSCSYQDSIVFNYYLVKLPIELIEYVVVHELSHIKHKHHQKSFWDEVAKVLPDVKLRRKKLRKFEKEM